MRLAVLALFLLSACAGFPLLDPSPVDGAVAEALSASRAPVAEQKAALARAEQAFVKEPSSSNRLKLATLLAALPGPLRDDGRAVELLAPLADALSPGAGRYAALLTMQVQERQRLARELERSARERERLASERAAADKERDKREEALRQQLEALRSIERNILEREDRLRRKAR
jgi:septal ring factor EnvC (AmiA/AmiB activator)